MTEPESDAPSLPATHRQPTRPEETIQAMADGADPAEQAFALSNEFTDRWSAGISERLKRLARRPKR